MYEIQDVYMLFVRGEYDTHDHQLHEFSPDYIAVRIQLSIYSEGFCSTEKNTPGVNQAKNWKIVTSTLIYLCLCILLVL